MTELEKARRDAAHARDELLQARLLLADAKGCLGAREQMGTALPIEAALLHNICKFMRRTSLFPKQEA
jgi:hypothetical protein